VYIDFSLFFISLAVLVGGILAMRFIERRSQREGSDRGMLTYAVLAFVTLGGAIGVWSSTSLGGNHRPIDETVIRNLGADAFNADYYRNGIVSHGEQDGLSDSWRYMDPDYANAEVTIEDKHSGEYCIDVTQEKGGDYGGTSRVTRCIHVEWDSVSDRFEADRLSDPY